MGKLIEILKKERILVILTGVTIFLFSLSFSFWLNLLLSYVSLPDFFISDTIFPILKSDRLYGAFIQTTYSFLNTTLMIAVLSVFLLFILLVIFALKNRKYINTLSLILTLVNFSIILCVIYFSCETEFYSIIFLFLTPQFQYEKFFIIVILYWLAYLILLFLGTLAFYISFTNINNLLKVRYNVVITSLLIVCLLAILTTINFYDKGLAMIDNSSFENIKGLELNTPKNQTWFLSVNKKGESTSNLLQKPHNKDKGSPQEKYALNEHNLRIIARNHLSESNHNLNSFLFSLLKSSFNLSENEKYYAKVFKENPSFLNLHSFRSFSRWATILEIRVNTNIESLKLVESVYNDSSMYISKDAKCFLSLIQYKLGNFKDAKINSKVPSRNNKYCDLTQKLLSGKIKKTTFTGILLENNKPLNKNKILLSLFSDDFAILGASDLTNSDSNGKFILKAQTDQPLYLVVVSNQPKKITFDYKKLSDYKQGSTVDLGNVVIK